MGETFDHRSSEPYERQCTRCSQATRNRASKAVSIGLAISHRTLDVLDKPQRHKGHKEEMQSSTSHYTSFVSFVPSWLITILRASAPRRETSLFFFLVIWLALACTTAADNWDRFRGP